MLRWAGGVERLGDTDPRQRRRAAEELARMAGDDEKPLLLELFADSDPLVRELSLRGLQHIGGAEAKAALVKLLGDPEPNVRAAVLKQLEESPDAAMAPAVVKYLKGEKDPDLVVHGIGFLRAAKGAEATRCLMSLLKHKSWQVRAEAAAAIGKLNDRTVSYSSGVSFDYASSSNNNSAAKLQADAYVALLDLLDDKDGFVVAKAVEGLSEADMALAVKPLAKVVGKHPDLAASVLKQLAEKSNMRQPAIPYLRKFCKHKIPKVRAAAIAALSTATSGDTEDELLAALGDKESEVRVAAASAFFKAMDQLRQAAKNRIENPTPGSATPTETTVVEVKVVETKPAVAAETLLSKIASLFGGGLSPPVPRPATPPRPASDKKTTKPAAKPSRANSGKEPSAVKPSAKGKPTDKKSGKKTEEEERNPRDQWLLDCYAGKGRPKWTSRMAAPLEKMLKANNAKERMAAAVALLPLGKAAVALPVALATARANRDLTDATAEILPWLVWKQRIKMFRDLSALAGDGQSRSRLISRWPKRPTVVRPSRCGRCWPTRS